MASELCKRRAKRGDIYICESVGTYKILLDIRGLGGRKERVRYVLKSSQRGDTHICEPGRRRTKCFGEEYSWDSAEGWDSKRGYYGCIGRGGCGFESCLERMQRQRETALIAELEKAKKEKEFQKRAYETELERLEHEVELEWLQHEAELELRQSENVEMPIFSLSEGPQQSARTAVALAAVAPAAEAMTGTCVFPDTATPDGSVARAAGEIGSVAGTSSEMCRERGASNHPFDPGTVLPLAARYHNSSSNGSNNNSSSSSNSNSSSSNSSSSNNNTTTTCAVALLRPFDPGKRCRRDSRRGKAVIGLDLPFDRGKHDGGHSMDGDGIRAEGEFFVLFD